MRRIYLQVPLAEEIRYLTAFITHDGVQYTHMCYGLCSAPSAFQKILTSILKGIPGCLNLLDDIVIHAPSPEVHDQRLNMVLDKLRKHNITLNSDKSKKNLNAP